MKTSKTVYAQKNDRMRTNVIQCEKSLKFLHANSAVNSIGEEGKPSSTSGNFRKPKDKTRVLKAQLEKIQNERSAKVTQLREQCRVEEEKKTEETKEEDKGLVDVRETMAPPAYELPVKMEKLYHQPHLENFFNAIRGKEKLNCPAEVGYETAVTVLKVNKAVEAQRKLEFKPEEFKLA